MVKHALSVDLGASGTKVFLSCIRHSDIELREVGRFESFWYSRRGLTFWDVDKLYNEITDIIRRLEKTCRIQSIGFDGWGVDFVPLDENDRKLMDPMRYFSMFAEQEKIKEEIEKHKRFINHCIPGQYQPFNTVYQLMYYKKMFPDLFAKIKKIVPIPCYLTGRLCGNYKYEFTHASTTQLYDFSKNEWNRDICEKFGFADFLPEVVRSGTIIGKTSSGIDCILPATHDTASAYAAISGDLSDTLIISVGTWCLNGVITKKKELNNAFILKNNLAVEGCYDGSLRILSNTPGLVFWQKIKAELETDEKRQIDYSELLQLSLKHRDFKKTIDVDNASYLLSTSILPTLQNDFQTENIGKILCGILNSLAYRINQTRTILEQGLQMRIKRVHMIGGGIQNTLLCEKIAETLKMDVYAGPTEGTALGNTIVQFLSEKTIQSPEEKSHLLEKASGMLKYT